MFRVASRQYICGIVCQRKGVRDARLARAIPGGFRLSLEVSAEEVLGDGSVWIVRVIPVPIRYRSDCDDRIRVGLRRARS